MLGHIKPPLCRLQPPTRARYRHLYCSLCYSLRHQFGLPASLLVSHESVLGLLACGDGLAAPLESRACPARLFCGQRPVYRDALVDKAARLNLLLVWLKLADWEADSRRAPIGPLRRYAERRVRPILEELSRTTRDFLDQYLALLNIGRPQFSMVRAQSGALARTLFGELAPEPRAATYGVMALVGEIIPVADALLDLPKDIARKQYNPIAEAAEREAVPLSQAYAGMQAEYQALTGQVRSTLAASGDARLGEALMAGLARLSARIEATAGGLLIAPPRRRRKEIPADAQPQSASCCGRAGDSLDCCDCCCECGCEAGDASHCSGLSCEGGCCDGLACDGCCCCDGCSCG
jgi:hypothetical protein